MTDSNPPSRSVNLKTWSGAMIQLTDEQIGLLTVSVRAKILTKDESDEYKEACKVWNAMIDRKPGMIVECTGHADVVACVKFCRMHKIKICVRGGGHNIAGKSIQDDHFLIDMSKWRAVFVDPVAHIARVAPGSTLGDIDHDTKEHGLVHAHGINSTTGISGLILGGGMGWLCRKFGMSCDNLVSAQVVTAEGKTVFANAEENTDLFWALRGGSGNFGIVTEFQVKLHKLESPEGHTVHAGPIVYAAEDAKKVLTKYAELVKTMPREMTAFAVFRQAPPFPFLSQDCHFKPVLIIAVCYTGSAETTEENVQPFKELNATPLGAHTGRMPLGTWNQAFDPMMGPGARGYWKSMNYQEISDGLIDVLVDRLTTLPNFGSDFFLGHMAGAVNDVASDACAYAHRDVGGLLNAHMRWDEASDDATCIDWARDWAKALEPHTLQSSYLNFVSADEEVSEVNVFDKNNDRLGEIKAKWDPDNFFSETYKIRATA